MPLHHRQSHRIYNLTPETQLRLRGLSRRAAEAALLAARGYRTREIAEQMQVTEGTVKTHLKRAREKLGCDTARELMAVLLHEGVVRPDDFLTPRSLGIAPAHQPTENRGSTKS